MTYQQAQAQAFARHYAAAASSDRPLSTAQLVLLFNAGFAAGAAFASEINTGPIGACACEESAKCP